MIPKHLYGKSAEDICKVVRSRFKDKAYDYIYVDLYIKFLEEILLLAVKDALCNISSGDHQFGQYGIGTKRGIHAEQRAIVFLNTVLPEE